MLSHTALSPACGLGTLRGQDLFTHAEYITDTNARYDAKTRGLRRGDRTGRMTSGDFWRRQGRLAISACEWEESQVKCAECSKSLQFQFLNCVRMC